MTLIKWSKPNLVRHGNDIFPWSPFSLMDDILSPEFGGRSTFVPAVNISEKDNAFLVEVSAPGLSKENFKIEAENDVLSISCEYKEEKKEENTKFNRREFRYSSFSRSFTLPENIHADEISARYENGILSVDLPKKEAEAKKVAKEIKVA